MSYVERILLPTEKVLFYGIVTPATYLPGTVLCILAVLCAKLLPGLSQEYYWAYSVHYYIYEISPTLAENGVAITTAILFLSGISWVVKAFITYISTEMAITNRRVIAKWGVSSTTTTEIDRRKIAGVTINQNLLGKLLNYGYVTLQGYSGTITGMPPISRPYDFQKYVNSRVM